MSGEDVKVARVCCTGGRSSVLPTVGASVMHLTDTVVCERVSHGDEVYKEGLGGCFVTVVTADLTVAVRGVSEEPRLDLCFRQQDLDFPHQSAQFGQLHAIAEKLGTRRNRHGDRPAWPPAANEVRIVREKLEVCCRCDVPCGPPVVERGVLPSTVDPLPIDLVQQPVERIRRRQPHDDKAPLIVSFVLNRHVGLP